MEAKRPTSDAEALGGVSNLLLRGLREHNAMLGRTIRKGASEDRDPTTAAFEGGRDRVGVVPTSPVTPMGDPNVGARRVWLNAHSSRHVADVAPRTLALRAGSFRF